MILLPNPNLWLIPQGEERLNSIAASMESVVSSLRNIEVCLLPDIDQEVQGARSLTVAMQHANNELFAQYERVSQLFEDISIQVEAYKHLAMSQTEPSRTIYLRKSIEQAQLIVVNFQEIISYQENITDHLMNHFSFPTPPTTVTQDLHRTINHPPTHFQSQTPRNHPSRRSLFSPFIRNRLRLSHIISTQAEDAVIASNEVIQSLGLLHFYYTRYLQHLENLRFTIPVSYTSKPKSKGDSRLHENGGDDEDTLCLTRMQKNWTEYQNVILEVINRLTMVADTIPRYHQLPQLLLPPLSDQSYFDSTGPSPSPPPSISSIDKNQVFAKTYGSKGQQSTLSFNLTMGGGSNRWSWVGPAIKFDLKVR